MRWTQDEDARLREAVAELGKGKWGLVADRLGTGRTPSAVEQHWQVMTGQRKSPEYYAARRPAAKCKGPKAEGSLAQPQPDEWRKEGHPLIGRSIIRLVEGGPAYSEGKVTGWLSAAESDFLDDTGQPAALFHVKYTKGELAGDQEDLELHEVKASIKIPDDSSDDFDDDDCDDDASAMSWES